MIQVVRVVHSYIKKLISPPNIFFEMVFPLRCSYQMKLLCSITVYHSNLILAVRLKSYSERVGFWVAKSLWVLYYYTVPCTYKLWHWHLSLPALHPCCIRMSLSLCWSLFYSLPSVGSVDFAILICCHVTICTFALLLFRLEDVFSIMKQA